MLTHLGRLRRPIGSPAVIKRMLPRLDARLPGAESGLVRVDGHRPDVDGSELLKLCSIACLAMSMKDACLLLFRQVARHSDDWPPIYRGMRPYAPCFIHHVLHGQADLRVGRQRMRIQVGDVFAMDMNVEHEVTSRSLCLTACFTAARSDVRRLCRQRTDSTPQ